MNCADDLYEFDDIQSPTVAPSSLTPLPPLSGATSLPQSSTTGTPVREASDASDGSGSSQPPKWDDYHVATADALLSATRLRSISHALSSPTLPDVVKEHGFITPEDIKAFIANSEVYYSSL